MAGYPVPPDSFNLDDLPDVALDDPNDEFMQYLETLDIPAPDGQAFSDFVGEDVISAGSRADTSRSGKRSANRKQVEAAKSNLSNGESNSAQDDKLTKMREKNRQAQARFRKRQKQERDDLEARIQNTKERLQAATARRRSLSATNQQLVKRAGDAAGLLLNARRSVEALESRAAHTPAAPAMHTPGNPDSAVAALPASIISVYMPVPTPRPIESFAHHFPLAVDAVLAHCPQDPAAAGPRSTADGDGSTPFSSEHFPALVRAYKADVAATVQRSVSDICWVIQTPLRVGNGANLSFSSTMSSLECCASFLIFYFATTLEGAFMAQEQAHTDGAISDSLNLSGATTHDEGLFRQLEALCAAPVPGSASNTIDAAGATSASSMANLLCSCNVRETFLLSAAVSQVFSRIIAQYRSCLPHAAWHSVCVSFAQLMLTVRGAQGKGPNPMEEVEGMPNDAFKEKLVATKFSIGQHVARALLATLRNPHSLALQSWHSQESPGWEVPCEERMHHLFSAWSLANSQILQDSRRLVRRLMVSGPAQLSYCTAEDKNITLFASLRLTKRQKVNLACMWRQWHAGRLALDEDLTSILSTLSQLPSSEDIPASLVLYIAARARGTSSLLQSFDTQITATETLRTASQWGSKLLGISASATSDADRSFQQLLDVHDRDASLLEEFVAAITVPATVLTPRQHALFCSSCVKCCVPLVDLLRLAQTAAMEEKRMMLLRPFVFTNPSVMTVGN